jgi:formate-dependent nitrite reductase membrane component NrfD
VWEPIIALYYYVGGLSGASLALAAAGQTINAYPFRQLTKRCRWIGIVGASIGGACLVYDLGRPGRFLYMLRVFRPTSPMNIGAWILSGAVPFTWGAELLDGFHGLPGLISRTLGYCSGLVGLGLATYTGVLVSNSAIPVWSESRSILPLLFAASAVNSAASMLDLFPVPDQPATVTVFGTVGKVGELAASLALEKRLNQVDRVALPLRQGVSGFFWRASNVLTVASLAVNFLPMRKRKRQIAAGVLGTLGSLALRYAIHKAGTASAHDSRASFRLQRAARQVPVDDFASPMRHAQLQRS